MRRGLLLPLCLVLLGAYVQAQSLRRGPAPALAADAGAQLAQVTLSPSYQQSNPGVAVSMAAAVGPASGTGPTPTGTITFFDNYDNLNAQIGSPASLSAGQLTSGWSTLAVGSHSISGQYSGDSNYAPVTSSPVTILIQKFTPNLTLTVSSTSAAVGGTITATAAIASTQLTPPTGSVAFTLDNNAAGIVTLGGSSPAYTASQTISITTGGSHTIAAAYGGDADYASATAPSVNITTAKSATLTTVTATPATLTAGSPETLTAAIASVTATSGTNSFTGTVTFYDATTQLGTPATVAGTQAVLSGVNLSATASHSLTAIYSGDANWLGSTSATLVLSSAGPSSVTLTASNPVALAGAAVTFTATVSGTATTSSGNPVGPTGTVTFQDASTTIGQGTLQTLDGKATATLFTSGLSSGSHQITAHYAGDSNFKAEVSSPLTIAIEAYSITPAATALTLNQGQSGTILYTVADAGGLSTAMQFSCQEPPNTFTTCTFAPTSLTGDGKTTLTVTTSAPAGNAAGDLRLLGAQGSALACVLFCCTSFGARFRRTIGLRLFLMLPLLLLGIALAGCGGNSSSSHLSPSTPTPTGTQVFKVITSTTLNNQTIEQDTWITVNVLPAA